jgi:hypothetical protein
MNEPSPWPTDRDGDYPVQDDSHPPALAGHSRFYFTVAYRWGYTNEHSYFVYVGTDQVKAVTLAENEAQDRGGKYGCAVYEFDENGIDYQLIFYSPSMSEDQTDREPKHNFRLDYLTMMGLFFDGACDGAVYLPGEAGKGAKHTLVDVPEVLKAERDRQLEQLHSLMYADDQQRAARAKK